MAPADVEAALDAARSGAAAWASTSVEDRADRVHRMADLYEAHAAELFKLAAREAGKTWPDAVGEVREACDFARFYANEALREAVRGRRLPRGVIACISPWNFPLAIFSGQILAALAAGNAVVAKPAEQTPLIAARAVALMHEAGIPRDAVQLLPGDGATVGADAREAVRRDRRAPHRRPLKPRHRRRPGHRRQCAGTHRVVLPSRRAGEPRTEAARGAGRRQVRAAHGARNAPSRLAGRAPGRSVRSPRTRSPARTASPRSRAVRTARCWRRCARRSPGVPDPSCR